MRRVRVAFLVLLLGAGALAKGGRPAAKVVEVRAFDGERVNVTLLAKDRASRPLDLFVEYRVKGVKGWHPATTDPALAAVPSSPGGTELPFRWLAREDLGTSYHRKVRLRVAVVEPKGRRRRSKRTELFLYRETGGAELRADLAADLEADGRLDSLVLIDTREPRNFRTGALPGAIPLSLEEILEKGADALPWPPDTRIVFYCYGGS